MKIYIARNKQVNALCRCLAENGKVLTLAVILGITALISWRYYQCHQSDDILEISRSYQKISDRLITNKPDAVATAEKFLQTNNNSYGALVALQLAKYFIEKNDFPQAEKQLVLMNSQAIDNNLLAQVNLRLARIQLQEKKWDYALRTLDKIKDTGWAALVQDTRGNVLLAKGDSKGARAAYAQSLKSNASQSLELLLHMKLNNLLNLWEPHTIA